MKSIRNRNVKIQLWLNKAEARNLQEKARRSHQSVAAYLRQLINGVVPKEAPPPDFFSMMRELHYIGNNLNQIAILKHPNVALTTDGQAAAYQHGTDPLSVAAVSINLEKLKQAVPEDTDTGDYVILTEEEVYDFMRRKAQENNQNQNSNYQEVTYEKHHSQHHSSHPSYF